MQPGRPRVLTPLTGASQAPPAHRMAPVVAQLLPRLFSTAPCAQAHCSSSPFVLTPSLSHQLLGHPCHKNCPAQDRAPAHEWGAGAASQLVKMLLQCFCTPQSHPVPSLLSPGGTGWVSQRLLCQPQDLPVYSGKQMVRGDFLIFSANRSFLLRKRMMEVSMKNLLLQMESKSMRDSCMRFCKGEHRGRRGERGRQRQRVRGEKNIFVN